MTVNLADLVPGIRDLIDDNLEYFTDVNTYSSSNIFTISEPNATAVSDVRVNSISSGVTYTYSLATQKVTITSSLLTGDSTEIDFSYFNNYSDTSITRYAKSALTHISTRQQKDFRIIGSAIYPEPDLNEQNLIMMIASILIDPPRKQLRLPDLTITYADKLSKSELIDRTVSIFKHSGTGVFSLV